MKSKVAISAAAIALFAGLAVVPANAQDKPADPKGSAPAAAPAATAPAAKPADPKGSAPAEAPKK